MSLNIHFVRFSSFFTINTLPAGRTVCKRSHKFVFMKNPADINFRKRLALNLHNKYVSVEAELHELKYLFWECTLRCNLSCLHCGSDCRTSSEIQDMPIADFLRVTEQLKQHYNPNKLMIVLTGGEPLMRRDLEEFGYRISEQGYPWGMVTNGLALTESRFRALRHAGLGSMTVSFDGFESEHNWLRNNAVSFSRAVAAIKLMVAEPEFVYDVVTCVNPKNFSRLAEFKEFLISLGVTHWRIFTIFPTGRAKINDELKLSDAQFVELMEFIKTTRKEKRINLSYSCEGFLGSYENEVRDGFFFCRAGVHIASVLADGSVSACPNINHSFIQGNIYQEDFWNIWDNKFKNMREREFTKSGICSNCCVYDCCRGNGIHLHESETSGVQVCHYNKLLPK